MSQKESIERRARSLQTRPRFFSRVIYRRNGILTEIPYAWLSGHFSRLVRRRHVIRCRLRSIARVLARYPRVTYKDVPLHASGFAAGCYRVPRTTREERLITTTTTRTTTKTSSRISFFVQPSGSRTRPRLTVFWLCGLNCGNTVTGSSVRHPGVTGHISKARFRPLRM